MSDRIREITRDNDAAFVSHGIIGTSETVHLMDNFWFERRLTPGDETDTRKAGNLSNEAEELYAVMTRIPFQRLKTRTLPTLVQAEDCNRCGEDMAILAMTAYLRDSYNEHPSGTYTSWRLETNKTIGAIAEENGADLHSFLHTIAVPWTRKVVATELKLSRE